MIPHKEIELVLSTSLETPSTLFNLVMEYAIRTSKDPWECFGEAFSPMRLSVLFKHRNRYIGYCNFSITDDNVMFFDHGLVKAQIDSVADLMEMIHSKVCAVTNTVPKKIELHSDLPPRLWKRWGFTESKVKIYERFMGGHNNG